MNPLLWAFSYLFLSISLSCITTLSLHASRDNYYKPCEDQLVFKQLNKQGLGVLTVTIQQPSNEIVEKKIICVQHYRGHCSKTPFASILRYLYAL